MASLEERVKPIERKAGLLQTSTSEATHNLHRLQPFLHLLYLLLVFRSIFLCIGFTSKGGRSLIRTSHPEVWETATRHWCDLCRRLIGSSTRTSLTRLGCIQTEQTLQKQFSHSHLHWSVRCTFTFQTVLTTANTTSSLVSCTTGTWLRLHLHRCVSQLEVFVVLSMTSYCCWLLSARLTFMFSILLVHPGSDLTSSTVFCHFPSGWRKGF